MLFRSGVLTLTSAGGTATLAQWTAALKSVTYNNTSDNPSTTARTVSLVVNDGGTSNNLSTAITNTINVSLIPKIPYDMVRDFDPVAQLFITTSIMTAHPSLPVKSVKELITLAKSSTTPIIYGSAGNGSPSHLAGELLKTMSGIKLLHVPYKGGGPAVIEQVAGHVQLAFLSAPAVVPYIKTGRLRGLAVTNGKRSQVFPELLTIAEAALPGYESEGWSGIFVPVRTPAAVVQRLNSEFANALRDNDIRTKLIATGSEPAFMPPDAFGTKVRDEIMRWGKVVKASGMKEIGRAHV